MHAQSKAEGTMSLAEVHVVAAIAAATIRYTTQRGYGLTPRRCHTQAMIAAARILGTQTGAWDIATLVQDEVESKLTTTKEA